MLRRLLRRAARLRQTQRPGYRLWRLAPLVVLAVVALVAFLLLRDDDATRAFDVGTVEVTVRVPSTDGPHPVVLHVPGGGWIGIDETQVGKAFGLDEAVAAGWAVASVRYPLADPTTGTDASAQADAIAGVLRWLQDTGPTEGLDRPLVGLGHSAGAHLLALASARAEPQHQPDALVLVAGVYDLEADVRSAPHLEAGLRAAAGCDAAGCDGAASFAPGQLADAGDPPATVIHGVADRVAPAPGSARYAAILEAAGVSVTLRLVEDGGHRGGPVDAEVRRSLRDALDQAAAERSNR